MAEGPEGVEAVKVEMQVPILVTKVSKGKVTLVMGGKEYVLHEGETLAVDFQGSIR